MTRKQILTSACSWLLQNDAKFMDNEKFCLTCSRNRIFWYRQNKTLGIVQNAFWHRFLRLSDPKNISLVERQHMFNISPFSVYPGLKQHGGHSLERGAVVQVPPVPVIWRSQRSRTAIGEFCKRAPADIPSPKFTFFWRCLFSS